MDLAHPDHDRRVGRHPAGEGGGEDVEVVLETVPAALDVRRVQRRLGQVQRPVLGRGATGRTGAAVAVGEDHLDGSACVGEGEHVPYFRKSGTSRSSSSNWT